MGRKRRVKPAPKKFASPKLKEVQGPWSISYNHVDLSGPFAWPDESNPLFAELATFMAKLSLLEIEDCTSILRASGTLAHGPTTGGLNSLADTRLTALSSSSQQLEDLVFNGEIIRFTYCYNYNQPERIYGLRSGSVVFLLWWDPNHQVAGPQTAHAAPSCSGQHGCHHK